jgi:hypothetical protein
MLVSSKRLAPIRDITRAILVLRGHRVILDRELASIYDVTTGRLNEAVKRNAERFQEDFMFQLAARKPDYLRSQFAISNPDRHPPERWPGMDRNHGRACSGTAGWHRPEYALKQTLLPMSS